MNDEDDDYEYYRSMYKSSLLWSVGLVILFGLAAWIL